MATSQLNLADLFGAAATALSQNQGALNQTDSYNQNHGDNMVQIFNLINQAIAEKPKAPPSDQLAYAGRMVRSQANSGSAQVYAGALETASQQFQGKSLDSDNAMELITTLLSGGQAPQAPVTPQGTDLISALLGSFAGDEGASARSSKSQKDEPVIDAEDLMRGGMAYMSAQQRGASGSEAIMDAIISGSPLGESPQRAQSAKLIGGALLTAVTAYAASKSKSASKSQKPKSSGSKARQTTQPQAKKSTGIKRKARP
jgi:hypothetical protein